MRYYAVRLELQVQADTPEEAAKEADIVLANPQQGWWFDIQLLGEDNKPTGPVHQIDTETLERKAGS